MLLLADMLLAVSTSHQKGKTGLRLMLTVQQEVTCGLLNYLGSAQDKQEMLSFHDWWERTD